VALSCALWVTVSLQCTKLRAVAFPTRVEINRKRSGRQRPTASKRHVPAADGNKSCRAVDQLAKSTGRIATQPCRTPGMKGFTMISVRSVTPLERFEVLLEFSSGDHKVVDLEPLLHGPIFEALLSNSELFRSVRVDEEIGTIVWPNGADLDPNVLYGSHSPAWKDADAESIARSSCGLPPFPPPPPTMASELN
jgi:hypothetical protein